jgi:hypothetical protein
VILSISTESAPLVVVYTKSDKLLESKRLELQEENQSLVGEDLENQSKVEVKKVYDACEKSLKSVVSEMDPQIPEPRHVKVSGIISHSLFNQRHD